MSQVWSKFCPAKLNLYLAVTGPRGDGFHNLVSFTVKLDFGDTLSATLASGRADTLECDDAELPAGVDNLVLKAAAAFRQRVPGAPHMAFTLGKRIPSGAGMGGGSSDAAFALEIMNEACGGAMGLSELCEVAALVGSDCPLFLMKGPVIMRGRGEKLSAVPEGAARAISGQGMLVVKPHFSIPTGWAFKSLASAGAFMDELTSEQALAQWCASPIASMFPLANSFQNVVFEKYLCYKAVNNALIEKKLPPLALTGSGSAAFAMCTGDEVDDMRDVITQMIGGDLFMEFCRVDCSV